MERKEITKKEVRSLLDNPIFKRINKIIVFFATIVSIFLATLKWELLSNQNMVYSQYPNIRSEMIADSLLDSSGIVIKNTGNGDLTIKGIQVYKRGNHPIENTSFSLHNAFKLSYSDFRFNPILPEDTIKEGREHWILKTLINNPHTSKKVIETSNNISIAICYCSFNNCKLKIVGVNIEPSMQC